MLAFIGNMFDNRANYKWSKRLISVRRVDMSYSIVKTLQALAYLLQLDDNHKMNRLKLIKLLWVADRLHIRRHGRTITISDYYALPHGPVNSLALDIASINADYLSEEVIAYISKYLTADKSDTAMSLSPGDECLSASEKNMLEMAYQKFGQMDEFVLADNVSHRYPEWTKREEELKDGVSNRVLIDKSDFFQNPDDDEYFKEPSNVLNASKEAYAEYIEIDSLPGIMHS